MNPDIPAIGKCVSLRRICLKSGNDVKIAQELDAYITDAENGLRSILKVGFFLECIAADLPHCQLGPWIETYLPHRAWRTVQRWKQVSTALAEAVGLKNYNARVKMKLHEVLALPLGKVPEDLKNVREKIDNEIAGKSYRQLFLKFVQSKDGERADCGRLKGSNGNPKHIRDAGQFATEQERLTAMKIRADDVADWLAENSDLKGFGKLDEIEGGKKALVKLSESIEYAHKFLIGLKKSRNEY